MIRINTSKPFWRNKHEWSCPAHLPSAIIPANVPRCYFSSCHSLRPPTKEALEKLARERKEKAEAEKLKIEQNTCNYSGCENQISSSRKKYCSDTCRKKYAREQYRIRLKEKASKGE